MVASLRLAPLRSGLLTQISSIVLSGPIPASDNAAAIFTFAGNPFAPSRAVPSNTFLASVNPFREIPFAIK